MTINQALLSLFAGFVLLSCSISAPAPIFVDGDLNKADSALRRLKNSGFSRAWMRSDASLAGYDAVDLTYPDVIFRTPPRYSSKEAFGKNNYALSDGFTGELMSALEGSFRNEIASANGWRPLAEPNADEAQTLAIRVSLVDLIVHVPLELPGGDTLIWAQSIGAVTVIIDLYDAPTHRIIARFAERRQISPPSGRPIRANPGPALYQARQIFRSWARNLRLALESIETTGAATGSLATRLTTAGQRSPSGRSKVLSNGPWTNTSQASSISPLGQLSGPATVKNARPTSV